MAKRKDKTSSSASPESMVESLEERPPRAKMKCLKCAVRIGIYLLGALFLAMPFLLYLLGSETADDNSMIVGTLFGIAFVLLLIITVVEFIAPIFIEASVFTTAFMAFFLLIMAATSLAGISFYRNLGGTAPQEILYPIHQLAFFLCLTSFFSFERVYFFPEFKTWTLWVYCLFLVAIPAATLPAGRSWAIVGYCIGLLMYFVPTIMSMFALARKGKDNMTFFLTVLLNFTAIGFAIFEALQFFLGPRGSQAIELVDLFVITVCFALIFLVNYIIVDQRRKEEGARARHYESEALLFEINPHLIYNGLAAIKGKYRLGKEEGDRLIDSFADYLRGSLAIGRDKLIPLEKELDNLSTYIDFISDVTDFKGRVIFDIETVEGYIPPLSLQPFVENVFKHAGIVDREDGVLLISTRAYEGGTEVTIKDNGRGFSLKEQALGEGIKNVVGRSLLSLGEAPTIESEPNGGTTVRFYLRKESHD